MLLKSSADVLVSIAIGNEATIEGEFGILNFPLFVECVFGILRNPLSVIDLGVVSSLADAPYVWPGELQLIEPGDSAEGGTLLVVPGSSSKELQQASPFVEIRVSGTTRERDIFERQRVKLIINQEESCTALWPCSSMRNRSVAGQN